MIRGVKAKKGLKRWRKTTRCGYPEDLNLKCALARTRYPLLQDSLVG